MASKDIPVTRQGSQPTREEAREQALRPAVDIFQTEQGLTLVADLPGVSKEALSVDIDKGILTLQGRIESTTRGEDIYREFSLGRYYRQFHLPEEVDAEKVSAELKNGVLTLKLPKAEAAKPRRIEITTH